MQPEDAAAGEPTETATPQREPEKIPIAPAVPDTQPRLGQETQKMRDIRAKRRTGVPNAEVAYRKSLGRGRR